MLIQGNSIKLLEGISGGDLEASAGQSLLVKAIYAVPSTLDGFLTLQIDRVTVGYYRLAGQSGNHLNYIRTGGLKLNLMEFLASKGINVSIPIAEGQTFTVSRGADAGYIVLVFDRHDAGDIRADMPNGSAAKEYTFMQYMDISAKAAGDGDAVFDLSNSPAEFPDFPCAKSVPAGHRITLLGLVGCPFCKGESGSKGWYTTAIKLIREREVLFDEDRIGLPFLCEYTAANVDRYDAGFTLIGSCMRSLSMGGNGEGEPLIFDPPIVFESGMELNIYAAMTEVTAGGTWAEDVADLAAILKVEKV